MLVAKGTQDETLRALGAHIGGLWAHFGVIWAHFGSLWAPVWGHWGLLGLILGCLGSIIGVPWVTKMPPGCCGADPGKPIKTYVFS